MKNGPLPGRWVGPSNVTGVSLTCTELIFSQEWLNAFLTYFRFYILKLKGALGCYWVSRT